MSMRHSGVNKRGSRCLRLLCLLALLSNPLLADRVEVEIPVGLAQGTEAISAEDITVEVAGSRAEIVSIADARPSPRVVIYVDALLSSPLSVHNGLLELAEQAARLVDLGTVELERGAERSEAGCVSQPSSRQHGENLTALL